MAILVIIISLIVLGLCVTSGKERKTLITAILGILYFPLGVIMALSKMYK